MPPVKSDIRRASLPGSNPAATISRLVTRYHPSSVTMNFTAGCAARSHCCASWRLGEGVFFAVPMPAGETKTPPFDPRSAIVSVSASSETSPTSSGVIGPCSLRVPFRSTSSM